MASRRPFFLALLLLAAGMAAALVAPRVAWAAGAPAEAAEDATDYPPNDEGGYPGIATTPAYEAPEEPTAADLSPIPGPSQSPTSQNPTQQGTAGPTLSGSPSPTLNPLTPSATPAPDRFGTEDAEMGRSLVTPPPSETPLPSATQTSTTTPSPTPAGLDRFHFERGYFVLGLVLPLGLAAAGWFGYRLLRTGEFKDG